MVRSGRHLTIPIGALTLAVALGVGISAGPAFGDEQAPPNTTETTAVSSTTAETFTAPPATTEISAPPKSAPAASAIRAEDQRPDLRVSLAFDKPAYDAREQVGVTVTVVNAGAVPATEVKVVDWSGNLDIISWGALSYGGVRLEPGERAEVTETVFLKSVGADLTARMTVEVGSAEPDANLSDNTATVTAPVTMIRGSLGGVVYADRNMNAAMDPGEQLSDIEVEIAGGRPFDTNRQRTDLQGRFNFRNIPAGEYSVRFIVEPGWIAELQTVVVDGVHDPDIVARATVQMYEALSVTMAFTKNGYSSNEVAELAVRLTNKTSVTIPGITAQWTFNAPTTPQSGDLTAGGPGVTVPAGSTITVNVAVPIPPDAFRLGQFTIWGGFESPLAWGTASANTTARVPGGTAPRVVGSLWRMLGQPAHMGPGNIEPLPNTKVYLRHQVSGAAVVSAVTDANGTFVFTDVPADLYDFGIVGPWQIGWGHSTLQVYAGENDSESNYSRMFFVRPGPEQPDPNPAPSNPPQPQPGVEPQQPGQAGTNGLAETGANVTWLVIGGLLALAAGAGLVLRRGRTPRT